MAEVFIVGWFFGLSLGIALMSLRNTSKELDEVRRKIAQAERRTRK